MGGKPERLDKWIASQSALSRRQIGELARSGAVALNGVAVSSAAVKAVEGDAVTVQGKRMILSRYSYLMLNKPAGVVSATEDRRERTVLSLVPEALMRPGLFPAGRLDKDAEGFVLLTNDGAFAHRMLSPANHVPKAYYVRAAGSCDAEAMAEGFAQGVDIGGGDRASPAGLTVLSPPPDFSAEAVIYEGMYHQVKRMFARFGMEVTYLKRIRIGGLALDPGLPLGGCRVIMHNELASIC